MTFLKRRNGLVLDISRYIMNIAPLVIALFS